MVAAPRAASVAHEQQSRSRPSVAARGLDYEIGWNLFARQFYDTWVRLNGEIEKNSVFSHAPQSIFLAGIILHYYSGFMGNFVSSLLDLTFMLQTSSRQLSRGVCVLNVRYSAAHRR